MADWEKIRTEYITTECTQQQLAKKYGVNRTTIGRKAMKEGWATQRNNHVADVQQKALKAVASCKVSRAKKLAEASDTVIDKLVGYINGLDAEDMTGQDFNAVASALKKLQEVQGIKSEADQREQEARIEALRQRNNPASGLEGQHYGVIVLPDIEPIKPPDDSHT